MITILSSDRYVTLNKFYQNHFSIKKLTAHLKSYKTVVHKLFQLRAM